MAEKAAEQAWSVADAKARFSELIDIVWHDGPQVISRRGAPVAVVVSIEEWQRKSSRSGSLAQFFASSPLAGSELEVERESGAARDVSV